MKLKKVLTAGSILALGVATLYGLGNEIRTTHKYRGADSLEYKPAIKRPLSQFADSSRYITLHDLDYDGTPDVAQISAGIIGGGTPGCGGIIATVEERNPTDEEIKWFRKQ